MRGTPCNLEVSLTRNGVAKRLKDPAFTDSLNNWLAVLKPAGFVTFMCVVAACPPRTPQHVPLVLCSIVSKCLKASHLKFRQTVNRAFFGTHQLTAADFTPVFCFVITPLYSCN